MSTISGLIPLAASQPPRHSRRKRDFWLMLVGGNLAIVATVLFTRGNIVAVLFGLSGVVLLTVGLTWIMWFVLNDY